MIRGALRYTQGAIAMRKIVYYALPLVFLALLSACGDTSKAPAAGRTVKAVIKPTALTASRNIAGIELKISVPPGVAPPLLPNGDPIPADTVQITSSSVLSHDQNQLGVIFRPATSAAAPGDLSIYIIVAAGFKTTDEITIHLNVANDATPVTGDFRLISFKAFDINGVYLNDIEGHIDPTIIY
jgi:hypothetical protein